MISPRSLWSSLISSVIAGLVLAALVLLALGAWYLVIQVIILATGLGADDRGTNVPRQEVVNASALSTVKAPGYGGLVT